MHQQSRFHTIQALRGFAALLVLFFHLTPYLPQFIQPMAHWGFIGVDLFFVISGFVMMLTTENKQGAADSYSFVKKRMLRIYLGYWPVLLLWIGVLYVLESKVPVYEYTYNGIFLLSGKIDKQWLPVAWSLHFEVLFYLVFSGMVFFLPVAKRKTGCMFIILLIIFWNAFWLIFHQDTVLAGQQPLQDFITGSGIEFFAGAIIARYRHAFTHSWFMLMLLACMIMIGFALGTFYFTPFINVEIVRAFSFGLTSIALLIAAIIYEKNIKHKLYFLEKIGDISYSLYLIHTILIFIIVFITENYPLSKTDHNLLMMSMPLVIIALSALWYYCIEQPLYRYAIRYCK